MDLFGKKRRAEEKARREAEFHAEMKARIEAMTGKMNADPIDHDIEHIKAAFDRPRLEGLQFGDVLVQKKLGSGYRYKGGDKPAVFVRYANESDQAARKDGEPLRVADIIIADGIDTRGGELLSYAVESIYFERYVAPELPLPHVVEEGDDIEADGVGKLPAGTVIE